MIQGTCCEQPDTPPADFAEKGPCSRSRPTEHVEAGGKHTSIFVTEQCRVETTLPQGLAVYPLSPNLLPVARPVPVGQVGMGKGYAYAVSLSRRIMTLPC